MKLIEAASRDEIVRAFRAYPIAIVGGSPRITRCVSWTASTAPTEARRSPTHFRDSAGRGSESFRSLAHGAIVHAPPDADRQEIVAAIGRDIGRAAVHEFTHQLLGRQARIDDSIYVQSYEYRLCHSPGAILRSDAVGYCRAAAPAKVWNGLIDVISVVRMSPTYRP